MELNYTRVDSIISEIESSQIFKDNPNVIDRASIYRWTFLALRAFGKSIMEVKEHVEPISNFRGNLPNDFGQLSLAVFCEKDSYKVVKGGKDHLMNSYIWTEKLGGIYESDDCTLTPSCEQPKGMCVIERAYYNDGQGEVEINYKNPQYVKLGRNIISGGCTNNCVNRNVKQSPYSIDIQGNKILANFREGNIYMQYYGLPQDEDGLPIIPRTRLGYLERYIEQHLRNKLLKEAMYSKDVSNIQGLIQYDLQEEQDLLVRAMQDARDDSIQMLMHTISENRKRRASFEVNLGQI